MIYRPPKNRIRRFKTEENKSTEQEIDTTEEEKACTEDGMTATEQEKICTEAPVRATSKMTA